MARECECVGPGLCQRYQREMVGRNYEVCRGINVDLSVSAAFRAQWDREAISSRRPARRIHLKVDYEVGDCVAMTAAIYSLHRTHPGKYATSVQSRFPEVFQYNPDVAVPTDGAEPLAMHYPEVHRSNERGIHFMQAWCEYLGKALGVHVPLLTERPRLYFAEPAPPLGDYWVICSGGKDMFTNKLWGRDHYQEVVYRLYQHGIRFVQVGDKAEDHPRLHCVDYAVGQTTLRQLFDLVRRSRGILCGVSLPMHVAAALGRPAVIISGGREPVAWNAYPQQHYLHTIGALPCRDLKGRTGVACWRSRVVPLGDGNDKDKETCERPVNGLPECMRLIRPEDVTRTILRYNTAHR